MTSASVGPLSSRLDRDWLRRVERDAMALGSALFYVLVVGRGLVGPFWNLVVPLLVVAGALLAGYRWLRDVDLYLARALVLAVLLTDHYGDAVFGVFAAASFAFLVFAAIDLGSPRRSVGRGIALGVVAAGAAVLLALPFH